jgi:hypothetical protein
VSSGDGGKNFVQINPNPSAIIVSAEGLFATPDIMINPAAGIALDIAGF